MTCRAVFIAARVPSTLPMATTNCTNGDHPRPARASVTHAPQSKIRAALISNGCSAIRAHHCLSTGGREPVEIQPPAPPAQRVGHRMNVAASSAANDTDRNELHPLPRREEGHQHFRLDLESLRVERQRRPSWQVNEAETRLR